MSSHSWPLRLLQTQGRSKTSIKFETASSRTPYDVVFLKKLTSLCFDRCRKVSIVARWTRSRWKFLKLTLPSFVSNEHFMNKNDPFPASFQFILRSKPVQYLMHDMGKFWIHFRSFERTIGRCNLAINQCEKLSIEYQLLLCELTTTQLWIS